jgi:hypothetical protein
MVSNAKTPNTLAYVVKATHVRNQIGRWGDGFVALFGVASVFFIALGAYATFRGSGSATTLQGATSAFFIGMALAALAMLWRCVHSTAEVTIELLTEIASRLPNTDAT